MTTIRMQLTLRNMWERHTEKRANTASSSGAVPASLFWHATSPVFSTTQLIPAAKFSWDDVTAWPRSTAATQPMSPPRMQAKSQRNRELQWSLRQSQCRPPETISAAGNKTTQSWSSVRMTAPLGLGHRRGYVIRNRGRRGHNKNTRPAARLLCLISSWHQPCIN